MNPPAAVLVALLLAAAPATAGAADPAGKPVSAAEAEKKARDYFTDTVLVTQDGKKVRFYSDVLKGHVVTINFMFTRCNDACPLLTQKMRQVKEGLGDLFGKPVRFVSLSVDPANDTPAAMKKFAEKNQAIHPEWIFLTGKKADLDKVMRKLGEFSETVEGHSTAFLAGNTMTRHWTKIRPDSPPQAIVEHVRRLAGEALGGGSPPARAQN
jgi:cytochrome oxidase Cu insertion factor (SCO1/SenC/PrrC family)